MNGHLLRFDKTKKMLFLDLETFNLNLSFSHNRPWEIATILVQGDEIIEKSQSYIKWPNCDLFISKGAADITKFDHALYTEKARSEEEVFEEYYPKIEACDHIIMHNGLFFDCYLIKEWYRLHGKPWKHLINKIIDTNYIARGIKMNIQYDGKGNFLEYQYRVSSVRMKGIKTRLAILGKEMNIEGVNYDNLHSAMEDLKLNFLVWQKLKFQIEI